MEENTGAECEQNDDELRCVLADFNIENVYVYTGERPLTNYHMDIYAFSYIYGVTEATFDAKKESILKRLSNIYPSHKVDVEINGYVLHTSYDVIVSEIPDFKEQFGFDAKSATFSSLEQTVIERGGYCYYGYLPPKELCTDICKNP